MAMKRNVALEIGQAVEAAAAGARRQMAKQKLSRVAVLQEKLPDALEPPHLQLPRLVYLSSTSETANAVQSLVRAGVADPSRCCAILDKHDGVHMLRALMSSQGPGKPATHTHRRAAAAGERLRPLVHVVDCSVIYDDLLRQVRVWARLGHSAQEIQAELDARFQPIGDVLDWKLAK